MRDGRYGRCEMADCLSTEHGISSHACFIGMQSFALAWLFMLALLALLALFIFEIGFLMVLVIMRITIRLAGAGVSRMG
jgi:hypothetical protein